MARRGKAILILVALLILGTQKVRGQEMAIQFYIIPVAVVITPAGSPFRYPMYLKARFNPGGLDVRWVMRDYGGVGETTMVVCVGAEQAEHDWLAVQDGVYQIPADLDSNPSPQELSAFEAHLEGASIPANWLKPSDTWRTALRTVLGMFATAGKYAVIARESILDADVQMNTQFRNYPQYVADALEQVATNMGYSWGEVKNNWTTRILLKWFADQWPNDVFKFGSLGTI